MFCPKCSQRQVSEEVRFCSRCGFPLGGVVRLLDGNGQLAEVEEVGALRLTNRQRGKRKGLLIMAGGFSFGLLAVLLAAIKEDFFVLMLPAALALVVGFMRMLYGMMLEDNAPAPTREKNRAGEKAKTPRTLEGARARGTELPPARGFDAANFARTRSKTSEMAAPTSVTENTTRLLEDE